VVRDGHSVPSRWLKPGSGGWQLNTIYTRQTGQPFTFMGTVPHHRRPVYYGDQLKFNPRETNGLAFNTSAFNTKTVEQFAYHIRTFSTRFPACAGWHQRSQCVMLKKVDFSDSGKRYFQFVSRLSTCSTTRHLRSATGPDQLGVRADYSDLQPSRSIH